MLLAVTPLGAQTAATVPASSPAYDRLESVSAFFPVRGVFLGERPVSRREMRRIVERLSFALDNAPPGVSAARVAWARRELALVARELSSTRGTYRMSEAVARVSGQAELSASDAEVVRFDGNGLGLIDAVSHPFEVRRFGWPVPRGGSRLGLSATGVLGVRNYLALAIQPLVVPDNPNETGSTADLRLERAYARGVWRDVALQLGADELKWGQSPTGSLFISGNAPTFPSIQVATDTPITLPWLFRALGPLRATAFVADLGPTQDPPHARLAGWQASISPWSRFELGVAVLVQTGGNGGPKATFFERVVDFFPVIDALAPQAADLQFSNKVAGGNLRLRFPELSGLDFYYELQLDDFDGRRLRSSFVDDGAHLLGARLPILIGNGQLAWRAEWVRTSLRLYQHAEFRSGVTHRERIIGSPLGAHAAGAYSSIAWQPSPAYQLAISVADERRDPSLYQIVSDQARDRAFRFVRLTDDPDIRRRRLIADFERPLSIGALRLTLGYNRAWRGGGAGANEWLAQAAVRSQLLPTF